MKIKVCGGFVLLDKKNFRKIMRYSWYVAGNGYAVSDVGSRKRTGSRKIIRMHRLIVGAKRGELVDHRNRNKLDNRSINLRFCNRSTNGMNRGKQANNKSGYKGVSWNKKKKNGGL